MYKRRKKRPNPISSLRVSEYPRTTNKRRDKIILRGEVERAREELGRVRGQWSPRNFCPRYLVNLLITQSNAWDKPSSSSFFFFLVEKLVRQTIIENIIDNNLNDSFFFFSNKLIFILQVAILYFYIYKNYIYYI